jgi:hypothetical protein
MPEIDVADPAREFDSAPATVAFYADRDATAAMALLGSCGPRVDETRHRLIHINRTWRNDG